MNHVKLAKRLLIVFAILYTAYVLYQLWVGWLLTTHTNKKHISQIFDIELYVLSH